PPTATPGPPPQIAVLVYHHFGVPAAGDYDCSLDKFEDQLQWLKAQGYESVLPQQWLDAAAGRTPLPPHPVMFTFDDNNGEQYTDAAPLLEKYGYRGVFFIMTVTIGKRYYMKADQLRDLERRGHVIGGHTWDHRNMAILTLEELQKQLDLSESDLNEVLGHKPQFVSYPFGAYTEDVVAELEHRGYHGAFRLRDPADPQVAPQFMIHRQIIPGVWSIEDFADNVHNMEPEPPPSPTP
ncbi:MAG: polysaccharide deacetylase family protein, partial [Chloroflexota bacterium]|nr:polysaccharide deacetylase family protein [Chloroflexota bacterium]